MEGQQVNLNFGFPPPPTETAHVSPDPAQASSDSAQVSADAAQVSTDAAHVSGEGLGAAQVGGGLGAAQVSGVQKKRGRPRKYGPDGTVVHRPRAAALSPMPISASFPLAGDFPSWKPSSKGRSVDSFKKKNKLLHLDTPGKHVAYSGGENLIPHVITVNAGEDVNNKIISFSQQQGSRAICVLSANGTVSNVTLRQPDSSGGTLTYEGRFEILSLTGSFTPSDIGGTKSRSGGMSVSLAGPDGRVLGGGLAGLLVAAGPVQVVIGSFLAGGQTQEEKPKKPTFEQNTTIYAPSPLNHHSAEAIYGGNNIHVSNHLSSENIINFQGSESNETNNGSHKFDISC